MSKLLAIGIALALFLFPLGALAYDQDPSPFKEFPNTNMPDYSTYEEPTYIDLSTSITGIVVYGSAEGLYPDWDENNVIVAKRGVGMFAQEGSAFYVGSHKGEHYFFTNAHVVKPGAMIIQITKNVSFITYPVKILTINVGLGKNTSLGSAPGEIIYINEEWDVAIVKVVGNWTALEDLGYRPVWTTISGYDALYPNMAVATIVSIRNEDFSKTPWFEVRYGRIVDTKPCLPGGLPETLLPWFSLTDVTTTLTIYPGDSGSPVFAFQNGEPVIIGLARAAAQYYDELTNTWYYYSYFTRIDILIPFIMEK
jgi:hypothetical protein